MSAREHDLVLYGASGFVGRLVAEQLAEHAPAGLRVALGGRSQQRLERVRAGLPGEASAWPIVIADSSDAAALDALANSTRVVATTVGPYLRYGLPLAMACARAGTHYADLTGEVLFVRQLIDAVPGHRRAHRRPDRHRLRLRLHPLRPRCPAAPRAGQRRRRGRPARHDAAGPRPGRPQRRHHRLPPRPARGGGRRPGSAPASCPTPTPWLRTRRPSRGRAGSATSARCSPTRRPGSGRARSSWRPSTPGSCGAATRCWATPTAAASATGRSAPTAPGAGGLLRATAVSGVLGLAMTAMAIPWTRTVFDRLAPSPGEGPSEQARRSGRFRMETRTITESGSALPGRGGRPGRPRVCRDVSHARRGGAVPGRRRGRSCLRAPGCSRPRRRWGLCLPSGCGAGGSR